MSFKLQRVKPEVGLILLSATSCMLHVLHLIPLSTADHDALFNISVFMTLEKRAANIKLQANDGVLGWKGIKCLLF
jgi:hypothetical protein